jgi:hypothetical protein
MNACMHPHLDPNVLEVFCCEMQQNDPVNLVALESFTAVRQVDAFQPVAHLRREGREETKRVSDSTRVHTTQ